MARAAETSEIASAIDTFLAHLSLERGLSPRTIEAYGRDLVRFASFMDAAGVRTPVAVRREHLVAFTRFLEREGLAPRSRARALVASRCLLRHHGALGSAGEDPLEGVSSPDFDTPLPRILRSDETAALIEAADSSTVLGLRDRSMLEVLYGCGLRVSELVTLRLGAVDRRAGLVRVIGKGR
jgi:integrase/recombinase XerD